MINLYTNHPTSSFVMYPDSDVTGSSSSKYQLVVSQDLDRSETTLEYLYVKRLNTDVQLNKSSVFVLQAYSGSIPTPDGQYTAQLYVGDISAVKWGQAHYKFGSLHKTWSDVGDFIGTLASTDRAYVHGSNLQEITTYTGTDQTGAYITYNS